MSVKKFDRSTDIKVAAPTCLCTRCLTMYESRVEMAKFRASMPEPEYDWPELEAASERSRGRA